MQTFQSKQILRVWIKWVDYSQRYGLVHFDEWLDRSSFLMIKQK